MTRRLSAEEKRVRYMTLATMMTYNKVTGDLTWKSGCGGRYENQVAGFIADKNIGYLKVKHKGIRYFCHIIAWIVATGYYPENQIDHINGDRLDNSFSNLRDVTAKINSRNAPRAYKSNTPYVGVQRYGNKWVAQCCGKHLGSFDCLGQAILARKTEEVRLGGFTQRHSLRPTLV